MKPKILLLDIETSPIECYTWGLFDQNIGLNQVKAHTSILSWSAKWLGSEKVYYMDQSNSKNLKDDKKILQGMWDLLDEADIVIGHNVKRFDTKKLNSRFVINGLKPPSSYRQIDTLTIAKKHFAFDSNKLKHLAQILGVKNKKLTQRYFAGFDLWKEVMQGNKKAWAEMKKYNIQDTIALEDVFNKLIPWDNGINFNVFNPEATTVCICGSDHLRKKGFEYSNSGKFQRFICLSCGKGFTSKVNEIKKEVRKAMLK